MHMCTQAYVRHVHHVHCVDSPVVQQAEYDSVASVTLIVHCSLLTCDSLSVSAQHSVLRGTMHAANSSVQACDEMVKMK
jgi:hypothetical protein